MCNKLCAFIHDALNRRPADNTKTQRGTDITPHRTFSPSDISPIYTRVQRDMTRSELHVLRWMHANQLPHQLTLGIFEICPLKYFP